MALQILGTTALVTGANRGIGRSAFEQCLDEGAADAAVGAGEEGGRAGNLKSHGNISFELTEQTGRFSQKA